MSDDAVQAESWRDVLQARTLRKALQKRADGVPTYSIPEAAALLSVSKEHLYRLVQADAFPAVQMRAGRGQGRYVVPAEAVDELLRRARAAGGCVECSDVVDTWGRTVPDGVA
ncbi:helix-turn-helix domain-containing protein [Pseudonocardia sp. N23]|uniref:helix-turn-helix domain-containing protein n=1 Tax=Pseudonocardia sp. N23 TaxID=1987376 RepID=UPI000BFBEE88|nr:helix-turn-helix domain-containing protein [Pseudonocardia sp. N23]